MLHKNKTVTIGVPILHPYVHWRFWKSYEQMDKPNSVLQIVTGTTIAVARNKLVSFSLNSDYLLFLDSDMVMPKDLLKRLMDWDRDVVGALAFQRSYPHNPTTMRLRNDKEYYQSEPTGGIMDVDATGCACLLIKTEVFKKIPAPWFDFSPYKGQLCFTSGRITNWIPQTQAVKETVS